ncbi:MAG: TIGR03545 family protein [Gammaproteobacteria bacterium]|nr:TIGR03545 family protein [Gammaproteobacteria bacterium]
MTKDNNQDTNKQNSLEQNKGHERDKGPEQKNKQEKKLKKKGMFRAIGAISFVVTLSAVVAGLYFFTAPAIKCAIIYAGEKATGAETNIEEVVVNWQPFSVEVIGFQQTDANQPTHNLIAFKRANASIDIFEWLLGKTIIDQLTIEALTYDSLRNSRGQVYVSSTNEEQQKAISKQANTLDNASKTTSFSIPSSDELLAKADLQTVAKGKQLQQVWQIEKQALEQAYGDVPDQSALKKYETQWQAIEDTKIKSLDDLKQVQKKLKALKAELKKDKNALAAVKKQYKTSKSNIDVAYNELKDAPEQDWQQIQQTLPIQDPNAVAISQLLFGDDIAEYVDAAQTYWQKAQPYIEKYQARRAQQEKAQAIIDLNEGRNISFELDNVYPDFLIKHLLVSINKQIDDQGFQFELKGQDITHQSYVIGKPSELTLTYIKNKVASGEQPFAAKADIDTNENGKSDVQGSWLLANKPLNEQSLISDSDMTLTLQSAKLFGQGSFEYQTELTSKNQFDFKQTQFVGEGSSELAEITLEALTPVQGFNLQIDLKGQFTKPDSNIKSDLDNQLKSAFKQAISKRWDKVKTDAKAQLQDELQSQLNLNSSDMAKLDNWQNELDNAEKELEKYSEENIEKMIAEKTAEQQAELKRKLDGEKRKLEEKAEKEKQQAKDKLKEKLKGKLKDFGL